MLILPVCTTTRFVLVSPHYPENVGACARAMKTMGLTDLAIVNPGRLAHPTHEMAHKMAVKSWDILESARVFSGLSAALRGIDVVFGTTSRRGQKGAVTAREASSLACQQAAQGKTHAVVFGNEKTGLTSQEIQLCAYSLRIPMAAQQPSVNLAQCVQLVAYEWFQAGLEQRIALETDKRSVPQESP